MELNQLLTREFWFSIDRVTIHAADKFFFIAGACLIVLYFGLRLFAWRSQHPVNKKLLRRFASLAGTVGFFEVLWGAFRYQNARFLGTRFFAGIFVLIGLWWLMVILKYLLTRYRKDKQAHEKQQLKLKYLQ